MTELPPRVSVIIPTHNRLPYLQQCLHALGLQTHPLDRIEVLVVADGCTDDTVEVLTTSSFPFALKTFAQSGSGAASARNRGARESTGDVLLFLDDDVIASPGLVEAHARRHSAAESKAVVGPYLLDVPTRGAFLQESLYRFWVRTFETMADPSHIAHYRDVLSGNLSMRVETFRRVGMFNSVFPGCGTEDYELGVRLLQHGVAIAYAPDAHARHLETTNLDRSLQRNRRGGSAEVVLAALHPEILPELRLARPDPLAYWLVFRAPATGRVIAAGAKGMLHLAERLRVRGLWRRVYGRLKAYWYWRGAADEVGSLDGLRRYLTNPARPLNGGDSRH